MAPLSRCAVEEVMRQGSQQAIAEDGDLQRTIARLMLLGKGNERLLETIALGRRAIRHCVIVQTGS
jgi:hypothetical protein